MTPCPLTVVLEKLTVLPNIAGLRLQYWTIFGAYMTAPRIILLIICIIVHEPEQISVPSGVNKSKWY